MGRVPHIYTDGEDWVVAYSVEEAQSYIAAMHGLDPDADQIYYPVYTQVPDEQGIYCNITESITVAVHEDLRQGLMSELHLPPTFSNCVRVLAGEWATALEKAGQVPSVAMSVNH